MAVAPSVEYRLTARRLPGRRPVGQQMAAWCLAWLGIAWAVASSRADDWPHWRGPHRNGVVGEHSGFHNGAWLPDNAAWQASVGEGSSSPLVVAGRLYTMGWGGGRDTVRCLDAATGRELWAVAYDCPKYGRQATGDEGLYSGPQSTPEFDPETGYLYTLSIDGDVNCFNTDPSGERVWSLNLYERYDVPRRPRHGRSGHRDYGYTTAPLLHGDWVIVEVGDDQGTLMAFDKRSGQQRWASACRDPAGHTGGPVPITVEGVPCVAVLTWQGLLVARLDAGHEGQTVAHHEWSTDFVNNIATPAVQGSSVLITSGYNRSAIRRLDITLAGGTPVWTQPFSSKICSPVIHDGHVYWSWQQVHCLDFDTGEPRWSGGSFGDAGSCIVTSDDRLVVWAGRGTLALIDAAGRSPGAYRQLAQRDAIFATDAWPHVVLADRRLYLRDRDGNLKCFALDSSAAD